VTPTTLYAGAEGFNGTASGVFKSTNGGGTWEAANNGLPIKTVVSLAIDPKTPATLYAGEYGYGVFKSTDGGGSWSAFNTGLTDTYVYALAIDPKTPARLYSGTDGEGVFAILQMEVKSQIFIPLLQRGP
jgi:photosystem II stability/assembly factor-like uncharacterized protein